MKNLYCELILLINNFETRKRDILPILADFEQKGSTHKDDYKKYLKEFDVCNSILRNLNKELENLCC